MAYAAWSVAFGEQPSASKWNILGTNDAAFNNGTGITALSHAVTAVANPYKFSAYRAADIGSVSTTTKISFDTEDFDTNSNFDATTNYRYTAPVTGYYYFTSQVYVGSLNATAQLIIYKNGSAFRFGRQTYGTTDTSPAIEVFCAVTSGDYFEVYLLFNGGGTKTIIGNTSVPGRPTAFSGYLVSRT